MNANPTAESRYDLVLYPSYAHAQTHPSRLAAIGRLMGLKPAPVTHCRVLELGCGDGSNLVPMAFGLPDSEFVGVDLAHRPIATGQGMVRDLGLKNAALHQGDLAALPAEWGSFDYVIAHGVYSWVPAPVRSQLLAVCRQHLKPEGIAFVSYNAFPGHHLRRMLREMMLFHVGHLEAPTEKVRQAMALVKFLADSRAESDPFREFMKHELEELLNHDEGYLFHDELADVNTPFYFTQFIAEASQQGLQFLAEADFFEMYPHSFAEATCRRLDELGANRVRREQYLDFLKCRRFRQTLLCHQEVALALEPRAEVIPEFQILSVAEAPVQPVALEPGVAVLFQTPKQAKVETDFPLGKAALLALRAVWPKALSFAELLARSLGRLQAAGVAVPEPAPAAEALRGFVLSLYSAGLAECQTWVAPYAEEAGPKPLASPVARWQARHRTVLTSLRHGGVQVADDIGRQLLLLLDGTRDREALLDHLLAFLKDRQALNLADGTESQARERIRGELEKNLQKLATFGLLLE